MGARGRAEQFYITARVLFATLFTLKRNERHRLVINDRLQVSARQIKVVKGIGEVR